MYIRLPLLLVVLALTLTSALEAATITKVKYRLDGKSVAQVIYSGGDGWKSERYWKLLGWAPEIISEMKIKPDEPGGKVATLKGKVVVSIEIRNSKIIGAATVDNLTLVRKDAESDRWHLSKEELKRLMAAVQEFK